MPVKSVAPVVSVAFVASVVSPRPKRALSEIGLPRRLLAPPFAGAKGGKTAWPDHGPKERKAVRTTQSDTTATLYLSLHRLLQVIPGEAATIGRGVVWIIGVLTGLVRWIN